MIKNESITNVPNPYHAQVFALDLFVNFKGTDQAGTLMSLKCVVYYANYRSWHQSSKIQVVS